MSNVTPTFDLPSDAKAHLRFLRAQPEFRGLLEGLRQDAAKMRRAGDPWREYGYLDVAGDARAIRYWHGGHRKLARVLPPKLRCLIPLLVRDLDAPIEISASCSLSAEQSVRLRRVCLHALRWNAAKISDADRKFMARALARLDPAREPVVVVGAPGVVTSLLGATMAINATDAAVGSWVACEPHAGYPSIGMGATVLPTGVGVIPFELPSAKSHWPESQASSHPPFSA